MSQSRRLNWTRPASKDLAKIGADNARRVRAGIARFAETGHGDVRKLTDSNPPEYRLRVGEYRVLFQPQHDAIVVLRVLPRDKAY